MICQSQFHRRRDLLSTTVVVLHFQSERRMRKTEVVVSFEQVQGGLDGLPGPSECGSPASELGIEEPDSQILPFDRGCVQKCVRDVAVGHIPPDALQLLPLRVFSTTP